ncbi:putative Flp pilus-assembly TadE/G-like protein [Vibrio crassostreae]|uniref:Putative Flp pilus-assembly TadG-like N-terminal domain-containing protein n=2 Tax=Vibrio crassostreae TaxID=246167 RepID=A0A4R2ECG7_9VIBR|nr:pilus assembly protein TadG-related protein [Vibrio crassostreae]MDH5949171.1 pilus assembly protein TadG-related protein [Vibrio crassostreae]ROO54725.1 putative Flp pilus-assembly TadE/G-like protein [Vibrio crassostreae]ROO56295.1 putative Flp pilus-assembly TadE/G-like protein [Vibrio crassostreae]ROO67928.1 putative Flp pilus-assembly TadE/G-like protein [Vibrio crassostreae]ROO68530.1 putative Flp pilus-assembly TadE/G-like protein [Vibrio crassostreae]
MLYRVSQSPKKQQGLVAVMITAALLVFLAVSALAIDINHMVVNKTRLQNAVDSAALAAATILDNSKDKDAVDAEVGTALNAMAASTGNQEIDFSTASIGIDYSNDPQDFTGSATFGANDDVYVRVRVDALEMDEFFIQLFGLEKVVSASAVAGPSSGLAYNNVVPIGVCIGDGTSDNDVNEDGYHDETGEEITNVFGYEVGTVHALKVGDSSLSEMGNGNYHLLDFGSGGNTIKEGLGGSYDQPVKIGEDITTKPGGTVGPTGDGLNTRFGDYGGGLSASDYPSDYVTTEPTNEITIDANTGEITFDDSYDYAQYKLDTNACIASGGAGCASNGVAWRRILPIPMVDCSGKSGGSTDFTVNKIGCFFLLQKAPTNNSGTPAVFGEFIHSCSVTGGSSSNQSTTEGAYRIVLYKDPDSGES